MRRAYTSLLPVLFLLVTNHSGLAQSFRLWDVAVSGKVSTLGLGVETAMALTALSNARVSFNAFNYPFRTAHEAKEIGKDGLEYHAKVRMRAVQMTYDYYLARNLHVGGGIAINNRQP